MKAIVSSMTAPVPVICLLVVLSCSSSAQTNSLALPPIPPIPHDGDYVLTVQGDSGALKWVPFGDVRLGTNVFPQPFLQPLRRLSEPLRTAPTNTPLVGVATNAHPVRDAAGVLSDEDYYASVLTGKTTNEVLAVLSPLTNQLALVKIQVEALKKDRDDLTKAYNQNRDPSLEQKLSINRLTLRFRERELQKVERRVAIVERFLRPSPPPATATTRGSNQVPEDTARKLADPQH